jgi:uncharacterized damage-inducible protein DinB
MELAIRSPFLITTVPDFTPHIGHLVMMMNYARLTTLRAVDGLTAEQLDYLMDGKSNSIGMLLAHIAAVEVEYQAVTFQGRDLSKHEEQSLGPALDLGELGRKEIKGHDLSYYLTNLEEVRNKTLEELARQDDVWLYKETDWWGGHKANNYFKWFHVLEDEVSHRGQMRIIRKYL